MSISHAPSVRLWADLSLDILKERREVGRGVCEVEKKEEGFSRITNFTCDAATDHRPEKSEYNLVLVLIH